MDEAIRTKRDERLKQSSLGKTIATSFQEWTRWAKKRFHNSSEYDNFAGWILQLFVQKSWQLCKKLEHSLSGFDDSENSAVIKAEKWVLNIPDQFTSL